MINNEKATGLTHHYPVAFLSAFSYVHMFSMRSVLILFAMQFR